MAAVAAADQYLLPENPWLAILLSINGTDTDRQTENSTDTRHFKTLAMCYTHCMIILENSHVWPFEFLHSAEKGNQVRAYVNVKHSTSYSVSFLLYLWFQYFISFSFMFVVRRLFVFCVFLWL